MPSERRAKRLWAELYAWALKKRGYVIGGRELVRRMDRMREAAPLVQGRGLKREPTK